jgi:hypothetical protein
MYVYSTELGIQLSFGKTSEFRGWGLTPQTPLGKPLSSGAQLQRIVMGFVSVEHRGSNIRGVEVYLIWICVYSFFKVLCDICVLVCVIGSVLVLRGHDVWFLRR